jgi:hypothetical protein
MATQIGGLDTRVGGLETDVGTLKTDVAELKTDVAVLKTDLVEFKGEFKVFARTTNHSINQLHDSFQKMSVTMEEQRR